MSWFNILKQSWAKTRIKNLASKYENMTSVIPYKESLSAITSFNVGRYTKEYISKDAIEKFYFNIRNIDSLSESVLEEAFQIHGKNTAKEVDGLRVNHTFSTYPHLVKDILTVTDDDGDSLLIIGREIIRKAGSNIDVSISLKNLGV